MSVVAPPEPPRTDELELLIREARARQRKRWGIAGLVALLAGGTAAAFAIAGGRSTHASPPSRGTPAGKGTEKCGIRVAGPQILRGGTVVYRDPSPAAMSATIRCSGSTIWVVFINGVGMMHEEYVGVRSGDTGRAWHVVFAQQPGVRSHGLDAEVGPWTLDGPRSAYFVGACPACRGFGTLSLSVTRDAGHTFRTYRVPGSDRWMPGSIRVYGRRVTIREQHDAGLHSSWRTVTLHVA
jgi:hypothetical protein